VVNKDDEMMMMMMCVCHFQTKRYLPKDTTSNNTKYDSSVSLPETNVGDVDTFKHQHLPTDISASDSRLQTSDSETFPAGTLMSLSQTSDVPASNLFTPVTVFVNSQTALTDLVCEHYGPSSSHHLMLTGLHTCGNLSADILRLFIATSSVQVVCQVGCCYNLLTERFLHIPDTSAHGNVTACSSALLEFLNKSLVNLNFCN